MAVRSSVFRLRPRRASTRWLPAALGLGLLAPLLAVGAVGDAPADAVAKTPISPQINQSSGQMVVSKLRTVRITASGYPKPAITESGALPAGVTFVPGNGSAQLTGTPAPGTGNDYNITFTATNSAGSDADEAYDLTVVQNVVFPTNFCPPALTVGTYSHYNQQVAAYPPFFGLSLNNDAPDDVTFSQSNTFSANDITEDDGWTSGTPAPGTGGKYHLQYSADTSPPVGNGQDKNFNCALVIDEAPTFTDAGTSIITAGQRLSTPLVIGGTTGYPKSITATATGVLPPGLTEQIKQTGKAFGAVLRGKPSAGSEGVYPIQVSGDNGITSSEEYILVVQAPGATPAAPTLALSSAASPVPYNASAQTYTATLSGGNAPTGYVQFSLGGAITTVPLSGGTASFTTPGALDQGSYTVTASYTGDMNNDPTSTSDSFVVTPASTTLVLSGPASTAAGIPATFTARVACSPDCGTTPYGFVDFNQGGNEFDVDLVNGVATFSTDPTIAPGLANEVDATYQPYADDPGDFVASTMQSAFYDIGSVALNTVVGDGVEADVTTAVANTDTVMVDPTATNQFSSILSAIDSGNGDPPGPLVFDITVGSTDETIAVVTQNGSEDEPTTDPGTGQTDYFWTLPADALTAISATGTATVTISSAGSDDFVPITEIFTLNW